MKSTISATIKLTNSIVKQARPTFRGAIISEAMDDEGRETRGIITVRKKTCKLQKKPLIWGK